MIKTLTQIKYRIDGIETIVQNSHLNIEKLIDSRISESSKFVENSDTLDMDTAIDFPINNDEELLQFETSIENKAYRSALVKKKVFIIKYFEF